MLSHLIFTRNQVGMQVKIRANEGRAKLVLAMPSVAEFGRSQHSGSDTSAVKHQGFIVKNTLCKRKIIYVNSQRPCVVNDTRTLRSEIS